MQTAAGAGRRSAGPVQRQPEYVGCQSVHPHHEEFISVLVVDAKRFQSVRQMMYSNIDFIFIFFMRVCYLVNVGICFYIAYHSKQERPGPWHINVLRRNA